MLAYHWGPGYRVYFGRDGAALVILLTGGTKRRRQRDVASARVLWAHYRRRPFPCQSTGCQGAAKLVKTNSSGAGDVAANVSLAAVL